MKTICIPLLFMLVFVAGCQADGPKNFEIQFSIETINTYRTSLQIDKQHNYSVQTQNLFFDNQARKQSIQSAAGRMSRSDYNTLRRLLAVNNLFAMNDSYGLDQKTDEAYPGGAAIYQIIYTVGDSTKYISIRPNPKDVFSGEFRQLISFLSNYLSANSKKPVKN